MTKLNKKLKENLYSEIDILKGLHHPHIVALIDCVETPKYIHLVMEYVSLGDLSYFIKKREKLADHEATADMMRKYPTPSAGGLNEVVVRHFLMQLASALEFLRNRNFIHRDVKPQNLLLNPSPHFFKKPGRETMAMAASANAFIPVVGVDSLPMLKLADFGFARSLPSTSLAETLCGSPLYMAPEILRYEKYDAKADLWSVGTVLYEMMFGRPPFRASNHVELLRKIEKQDDLIAFPAEVTASTAIKNLMRALLKRKPVQRMSFDDFFGNEVIRESIPGLVEDDLVQGQSTFRAENEQSSQAGKSRTAKAMDGHLPSTPSRKLSTDMTDMESNHGHNIPTEREDSSQAIDQSSKTGQPRRPSVPNRGYTSNFVLSSVRSAKETIPSRQPRPRLDSHATAPIGGVPKSDTSKQTSRLPHSGPDQQNDRAAREARKQADQDVAFERDYVVLDKKAVEVNALADELAASPRLQTGYSSSAQNAQGTMVRRATSSGVPASSAGIQVSPSRAMQIATGQQRPSAYHVRNHSYERRYGASPTSATSAISKALNLANFRLWGVSFSPPAIGKGGHSPPQPYGAFPAYPVNQGSLILISDSKQAVPEDADMYAVRMIEDIATRSDVVYGFAEVKYSQIIPLAPSTNHGLGLREVDGADAHQEPSLTADAIVILSEEALVLYVKALALLAKAMDVASIWWSNKRRGEVVGEIRPPRSEPQHIPSLAGEARVNRVVQWTRSRFNETLEKAEFVRLKLVEAQKQLPSTHPNHPDQQDVSSRTGMGTSADGVIITSGVTAEKLMYQRAVEMSRSAAVNELMNEDLRGCEIAYVTAIRMLEAVLESEKAPSSVKAEKIEKEPKEVVSEDSVINGMQAEDRKDIGKRKYIDYLSIHLRKLIYASR